MAERKLITPQFRVHVGPCIFTKGIQVECYSSIKERCSWTSIEYDSGYSGQLDFSDMAETRIELGYDDDYDTLLDGYIVNGKALGPYKILDDTVFLKRTNITETFLNCCPQDIIRYGLGKAGVENYRLSDVMYPKKNVISISRKNVLEMIQEIERIWKIQAICYFKNKCFYWGTSESQKQIYILEEGKNILSCTRFNREFEIKTIGVPWIHQGERIKIRHNQFSGEVVVTATHIKADKEGCVRMFLTFNAEG